MSLLKKAIVDAKELREAAKKDALNILQEQYAEQFKTTMNSILEQDDELDLPGDTDPSSALGAMGNMPAPSDPSVEQVPPAVTAGEKACPCPDEDEEIEIDFNSLLQQMGNQEQAFSSPQPGAEPGSIQGLGEQEMGQDTISVPPQLGPEIHKYHNGMGSAAYKVGSMAYENKPVPKELVRQAIDELNASKGTNPEVGGEIDKIITELQKLSSAEAPMEEDIVAELMGMLSEDEEALSMFEDLSMDYQNVPTAHAFGPTSAERQEATEAALAVASSDTRISKENDDRVKAIEKLHESKKIENTKLLETVKQVQTENNKLKQMLTEALDTLKNMSAREARLHYENRALKSDSLNERQKNIVVEAVSKTKTAQEAKIAFETAMKSVEDFVHNNEPPVLNEHIQKSTLFIRANVNDKKEDEVGPWRQRAKELAGIKKNR